MATTSQDISNLSAQLFALIGKSRGMADHRLRLRGQIVALDDLLQLWRDGDPIPSSEAVDRPLQRLVTTLSRLKSELHGQDSWPFTPDKTEELASEVQIGIGDLMQATSNKRALTSDHLGHPATVADAVQFLREQTPLAFMSLINRLKSLDREGWRRKGIKHPESVASHSFAVALMGLFAPAHLDRCKCMAIGLIHDWAESLVGDITPHDGVDKKEKSQREARAWRFIGEYLEQHSKNAAQLTSKLWSDYENPESPEGSWVKQADKLECVKQAVDYEEQFPDLDLEEFQGLESKITLPDLKLWLTGLQEYRKVSRSEQGQRPPLSVVAGDLPFQDEDCARHCQESGIDFIAWPGFVYEDSTNSPEARYFRASDGLVPDWLVIKLLWTEIEQRHLQGARCVLVKGFPSDEKQRVQFATNARRVRLGLLVQEDMPSDGPTDSVYIKVESNDTMDKVVKKLELLQLDGLN